MENQLKINGKLTFNKPLTMEHKMFLLLILGLKRENSLRKCYWKFKDVENAIFWDGPHNFYAAKKWLEIIIHFIDLLNYQLNGQVDYIANNYLSDSGILIVQSNKVTEYNLEDKDAKLHDDLPF